MRNMTIGSGYNAKLPDMEFEAVPFLLFDAPDSENQWGNYRKDPDVTTSEAVKSGAVFFTTQKHDGTMMFIYGAIAGLSYYVKSLIGPHLEEWDISPAYLYSRFYPPKNPRAQEDNILIFVNHKTDAGANEKLIKSIKPSEPTQPERPHQYWPGLDEED